jgi:hypothetical protein
MPIVLATEPSDEFLGLESNVRTGVHVLLVQPSKRAPMIGDTVSLPIEMIPDFVSSTHFFLTFPG